MKSSKSIPTPLPRRSAKLTSESKEPTEKTVWLSILSSHLKKPIGFGRKSKSPTKSSPIRKKEKNTIGATGYSHPKRRSSKMLILRGEEGSSRSVRSLSSKEMKI